MNRLMIIGNLTRDPELRTTPNGYTVCDFTVAVNNPRRNTQNQVDNQPAGQNDATFFRVSAWRQLGENCAQYLAKGRKVCVIGPVSARTYQANDGSTRVSLEVTANEVEFLSSRSDVQNGMMGEPTTTSQTATAPTSAPTAQSEGFTTVESDDLPF
jgi:single-strand DNA-binding protein